MKITVRRKSKTSCKKLDKKYLKGPILTMVLKNVFGKKSLEDLSRDQRLKNLVTL